LYFVATSLTLSLPNTDNKVGAGGAAVVVVPVDAPESSRAAAPGCCCFLVPSIVDQLLNMVVDGRRECGGVELHGRARRIKRAGRGRTVRRDAALASDADVDQKKKSCSIALSRAAFSFGGGGPASPHAWPGQ